MTQYLKTLLVIAGIFWLQTVAAETQEIPDSPETEASATDPAELPPHTPPLLAPAVQTAEEPVRIASIFGTQNLKVYKLPFEDHYPTGPFERLGDNQYLFISKCGDVYFTRLEGDELKLTRPGSQLTRYFPGSEDSTAESDARNVVYCKDLSGVKDSLLLKNTLFVAYTAWDAYNNGVRLAVSEFELDAFNSELIFKRDIYLSRPAIKEPLLGHQVGGKLALGEDNNTLFLSIGDFSKPDRVQDNKTSIGKVIRIDLQRLNARVYATGFRSPSGGLMFDRESKELWLTEHGPRGGDEINLVREGRNYGWPVVSYGTIYERDGMGNYYGNRFNTHDNFEKPAMTFLPSIGIGPIAKYAPTGKNDYWDGDYFVAGMAANTLYRIRKEGTRLVYAEPVLTGYRIRAMKIDHDGNFYLKTDSSQLLISE
jgi:glucose/arabinose dehydrogenase